MSMEYQYSNIILLDRSPNWTAKSMTWGVNCKYNHAYIFKEFQANILYVDVNKKPAYL